MDRIRYLEYRNDPLESVLDFKGLRKSIKAFKEEQLVDVLKNFHTSDNGFPRFLPVLSRENIALIDSGTHNLGIFSTALCLETIAAYQRNVDVCKDTIVGKDWVWEKEDRRRAEKMDASMPLAEERRKEERRGKEEEIKSWGKEKAYEYFRFIIEGLSGGLKADFGFLAKIATMVRFSNYLDHWEIKSRFIDGIENHEIRQRFNGICLDCILEFHNRLSIKKESIHPFELYRFLQFVNKWGNEIWNILEDESLIRNYFSHRRNTGEKNILKQRHKELREKLVIFVKNKVDAIDKTKITDELIDADAVKQAVQSSRTIAELSGVSEFCRIIDRARIVFDYFFDEVYLFAKYELYRQMSLKQSGDSKLFDAKRLIYSLLIVYLDNRFSNALIRNTALEIIFSQHKNDKNAVWATGQQVAMSKDGLMIISDNECVCDLLGCEALQNNLLKFINELKYIYDGYARTKRVENGKIIGWFPTHQRDKTPTSWATAFTLSFIKRFCKLLSLELSRKAKERFRINYRKVDVRWEEIYDSTAVKAKIRLMFPQYHNSMKGENLIETCKYKTAILFGPPGTGKTTYGRALAKRLGLDYLELTPGDFFAGGEASILEKINDIFEHLLHLKNTVVFIDEIDDLVKNRVPGPHYDRRSLFVNSLLPRFQELHDSGNIILLMATNNVEGVDEAIKRMGRVDLVIPVGAISPHGRLKYWHQFREKHRDLLGQLNSMSQKERVGLDMKYLNATEAFNFSTLKHYLELVIDEIRIKKTEDGTSIREIMDSLFMGLEDKKNEKNPLLIWQKNVIKKGFNYDTRPTHSDGDFHDFGHFNVLGYFHTKERFQKEFVELYYYLQQTLITIDIAKNIRNTITRYCDDFELEEEKKDRLCTERFYNIMTPFYDDVKDAINKRTKSPDAINELAICQSALKRLIYSRKMLAT